MQTRINSMINRPGVETLFPQRFLIVANAGLSIVRTSQKKEAGHSPFLRIYPQTDLFLALYQKFAPWETTEKNGTENSPLDSPGSQPWFIWLQACRLALDGSMLLCSKVVELWDFQGVKYG